MSYLHPRRSLSGRRRRIRVSRRLLLEGLERRLLLTSGWRNDFNSFDVNDDGFVTPFDVLAGINQLNKEGARQLPTVRPAPIVSPFPDVNGDGFHSAGDVLHVINELNLGDQSTVVALGEGERFLTRASRMIALGQQEGSRTLTFELDLAIDDADSATAVEDVLQVFLLEPGSDSRTLLDGGESGTALFSLSGERAEYQPGLVRFDGTTVAVDLTSLADETQGELVFQLLNTDTDDRTKVVSRSFVNEVDPSGSRNPVYDPRQVVVGSGGEVDVQSFVATDQIAARFTQVRFDAQTDQVVAELHLENLADDVGRSVAVVFPGLPDDVQLVNPSGLNSNGDPYLNFQPAIARGGLRHEASSAPVRIELHNPLRIRYSLQPQVVAGGPNRPPRFESADPLVLEMLPGERLEFAHPASDPDADPLTYTLRIPTAERDLPSGRLEGDGTLVFAPAPDDVGTYNFDVLASDGVTQVQRQVTLHVLPDATGTTRVSGRVLDTEGSPLVGLPIDLGALQTTTAEDGSFLLDLGTSGPLPDDTLKVHGEVLSGDFVYPFIAEKLSLVLGRPVYEDVNNVITRPIYLPALDVTQAQSIDPTDDTTVRVALREDEVPAEVFVEAGSLLDQDDNPYEGDLSITEVPPNLTPASLPPNLNPDSVVTIQPGDMQFTVPAPLRLPNRAGYLAAEVLDLWSINPQTGQFEKVGLGTVSQDGSILETTSGGIRNSSWHFFAPPGPLPNPNLDAYNPNDACPDFCDAQQGFTSTVQLHSGAVVESHQLVTYRSLGQDHGVRLVYDSLRADPRPIVHFGLQGIPMRGDDFMVGRLSVDVDGFEVQAPGYQGPDSFFCLRSPTDFCLNHPIPPVELEAGSNLWRVTGPLADAGLQVDLRSQPSGQYHYTLQYGVQRPIPALSARREGSHFIPLIYRLIGTTFEQEGTIAHVNTIGSPFGSGWGIAGLQHLVEGPDSSVMLVDGDGSELIFEPPTSESQPYGSPPEDFSMLEKLSDGTFRRTLRNQTVQTFDSSNRLSSRTDRNGNTTLYTYDGDGRLKTITDPVGQETTFQYAADTGWLQSASDPAGRITQFQHDVRGNLTAIISPDPDGEVGPLPPPQRTFGYDAEHHLIREIDERGFEERTYYDFAGRAIRAVRKDGSEIQVQPLQTVGVFPLEQSLPLGRTCVDIEPGSMLLPPRCVAIGPANFVTLQSLMGPNVPTLSTRARPAADFVDADGNVTTTELNRAGQVVSRSDAEGAMPVVDRDEDTQLITSITNSRGHVTNYRYDDQGNLASVQDSLSRVGGEAIGLFLNRITATPVRATTSFVVDVDADGNQDVVSVNNTQSSVALGDGQGGVEEGRIFTPTGAVAISEIADVNGDQIPDAIGLQGALVTVLLGDGQGGVGEPIVSTEPLLTSTRVGGVADFTSDGNTDLLLYRTSDTGELFLAPGNGDGSFGNRFEMGALKGLWRVELADMDGLGGLDVVALHEDAEGRLDTVSVLLSNGDGTLAAPTTYQVSGAINGILLIVGDVDGDGAEDVVTVSDSSAFNRTTTISVLRGNGDGTLGDRVDRRIATQQRFHSPQIRDVNGDGVGDVAFGDSNRGLVYFPGQRGANLGNETIVSLGSNTVLLELSDLNQDGNLEAIVLDNIGIQVTRGLGGGVFATPPLASVPPQTASRIALGDFDNDLDADLVSFGFAGVGSVQFAEANGDGTFQPAIEIAQQRRNLQTSAISTADVNNDGAQDVVFLGFDFGLSVLLGNGDATFMEPMTSDVGRQGSQMGTHFHLADVNNDGNLDALVVGNIYKLLLGNGDGTFQPPVDFSPLRSISQLDVADVDGDGNLDIVGFGDFDFVVEDRLFLLTGNGDGTFNEPTMLGFVDRPSTHPRIKLIDLDGDEDLDVVYTVDNRSGDRVETLINQGDTTFQAGPRFEVLSGGPRALEVIDLSGDGMLDILVHASRSIEVFLGNADGTFAAGFIYGAFAGTPQLGDINLDGQVDIVQVADNSGGRIGILLNTPRAGGVGTGQRDFTFDPTFNQLTSLTDELGRRTQFEIDPATGNILESRRVVGPDVDDDDLVTKFTYTARGLVDTIVDNAGRVTDYDYDTLGRQTQLTLAQGTPHESIQRLEYDPNSIAGRAGLVTASVDALGNRAEFRYDTLNRLIEIIQSDPDADGPLESPVIRLAYDAAGNKTTVIDASLNATQIEYDELGRMIATHDPSQGTANYEYDSRGNMISLTDSLGNTTLIDYDARNRPMSVTDPERGVTRIGYDLDNNIVSLIDAEQNRTIFVHDARDRLIREIDSEGNVISSDFDPVNHLIRRTDRDDRTIEYDYDEVDRLRSETWSAGGTVANTIRYTYDDLGNVTSALDDFSALTFTYDERDRVATASNMGTPGVLPVQLTYSYDSQNNIVSMAEAIDAQVTSTTSYLYDELSRLTRITQSGSGAAEKRVDLGYNALGQFDSIRRFADVSGSRSVVDTSFTYNSQNDLTALVHRQGATEVASYLLSHDGQGRVTSVTDQDGVHSYGYDDRGQLTMVTRSGDTQADEAYEYDQNGNRVASQLHGTNYVTGLDNRLLSDGTFDYDYDRSGNLIRRTEMGSSTVRDYEYDHRGRLTAVIERDAAGERRTEYTYDVWNRRISKSTGGETRYFVYHGNRVLLDLVDRDGEGPDRPVVEKRYLHGPAVDQVFAEETASGDVHWYLTDHMGTVRDITDAAGNLIHHLRYDAFGNPVDQNPATRYGFTGREWDAETGLYYYRARYYDPAVGRFISRDPLGFQGRDTNLYRYVNNAPTLFVDPSGMTATDPQDSTSNLDQQEQSPSLTDSLIAQFQQLFQPVSTLLDCTGGYSFSVTLVSGINDPELAAYFWQVMAEEEAEAEQLQLSQSLDPDPQEDATPNPLGPQADELQASVTNWLNLPWSSTPCPDPPPQSPPPALPPSTLEDLTTVCQLMPNTAGCNVQFNQQNNGSSQTQPTPPPPSNP